jgi:hypothetical protein
MAVMVVRRRIQKMKSREILAQLNSTDLVRALEPETLIILIQTP